MRDLREGYHMPEACDLCGIRARWTLVAPIEPKKHSAARMNEGEGVVRHIS